MERVDSQQSVMGLFSVSNLFSSVFERFSWPDANDYERKNVCAKLEAYVDVIHRLFGVLVSVSSSGPNDLWDPNLGPARQVSRSGDKV